MLPKSSIIVHDSKFTSILILEKTTSWEDINQY